MKLPTITRLVVEDFSKDIQGWIGKLIEPLNSFMSKVKSGLDKNITVNDNLAGQIKTLTVKVESPFKLLSFSYKSLRGPRCVLIGGFSNKDDPNEVLTNPVTCQWYYDANRSVITVQNVTNLTVSDTYYLTFLILDD
jgi:hypothetical protein